VKVTTWPGATVAEETSFLKARAGAGVSVGVSVRVGMGVGTGVRVGLIVGVAVGVAGRVAVGVKVGVTVTVTTVVGVTTVGRAVSAPTATGVVDKRGESACNGEAPSSMAAAAPITGEAARAFLGTYRLTGLRTRDRMISRFNTTLDRWVPPEKRRTAIWGPSHILVIPARREGS